ncbi:MAG: LysR family transcriptional regulator [Rubrivivax sp.]|nr:LysR family transcriptional regulator [Rubrivivax sp.]
MRPESDTRLPSLEGLRAFECAARMGTFERAAESLAITASAVAKRVAAVEELLGTPLLQRGARQLQLTAAGKEYLAHVQQALALLHAVPQHQRQTQRVQRLRISAPPTFARQVLVPRLDDFSRAQPQVELEIVLSIPFVEGPGADADVEIRHGPLPASGAVQLLHDVVTPMLSPALLQRLGGLQQPADLARAPLLRTPLEPWAPWFQAAGLTLPEPASGPKLVDLGLTLEAALAGQGVVLGRPSLAQAWLDSGALRAPFGTQATPLAQYHLLAHATSEAAQAFAAWLQAQGERLSQQALQTLRRATPAR